MTRDALLERLQMLDEEVGLLFPDSDRMRLVIVGGGALVLMEYLTRSTHDIDVLAVSHKIHDIMASYDMNTAVQTYINNFPYNYEDRLHPIKLDSRVIDFYTASLEDIVVAKLYSYRDKDQADITMPEVIKHVDWDRLEYLATDDNEAHASALNETRYQEFLLAYRDYERKYRK